MTLDSLESFVWKIYWKDLINSTASIQLRLSFIHKNILNFPYSICTTVTCISVNFSSLRIKFIFQKYSENEPINLGILVLTTQVNADVLRTYWRKALLIIWLVLVFV